MLRRSIRSDPLAGLAKTARDSSERRPPVGENAIDVISRIHLTHNRRDVLAIVRREHARAIQAWIFGMSNKLARAVAIEPLGMRLQRILPLQVGAHAS